jgi:hypothetical protein
LVADECESREKRACKGVVKVLGIRTTSGVVLLLTPLMSEKIIHKHLPFEPLSPWMR